MLNTKSKVVRQNTSFVITYDDGLVFDGSVGVGLEELIAELPEHARARDHYKDMLRYEKKLSSDGKEKFCRDNVMTILVTLPTGTPLEERAEKAWKICETIWSVRYPKKG